MRKLFGTDGVRGVANLELTPELAFELGRAGAFVLSQKKINHAPRIIIGKDTRLSCYMLESALSAGICSVGAHAYWCGVVPTPAIAYLVKKHEFDAGVMISASHNKFCDNGIKFFDNNGFKLLDLIENEIENIIFDKQKLKELTRPVGKDLGLITYWHSAINDYIDFLENILGKLDLSNLKIALDCANGATFKAAPEIFERLGAKVFVINNKPDGENINSKCGSTHMNCLVDFMRDKDLDAGFAFDGDGDRCLAVDENLNILHGDEIMSICAYYLKEKNLLKQNSLVATIMSNLGLFITCKKLKINIKQVAVGDRYVLEEMLANGYNLGGERSGHIIFLDHNTTGDGILTALYISKILKESQKKLSELNNLELMPQVLLNAKVSNAKKYKYLSNKKIKSEIKLLEEKFKDHGRVVIRPSGTEALVRVMLEGQDKKILDQAAKNLVDLMEKYLN